MSTTAILGSPNQFCTEFSRCCEKYDKLRIAVAWCGDPEKTLPYEILNGFSGRISVVVGISFNHTHPDAIQWFLDRGTEIRIHKDGDDLFHPKIYYFGNPRHCTVFIGSSNFTYGGFYTNQEFNCLIENQGRGGSRIDMASLERAWQIWTSFNSSFVPTRQWLNKYRRAYAASQKRQRKHSVPTPSLTEDRIPPGSWIRYATWESFRRRIQTGLREHNRPGTEYHDILNVALSEIPVPWKRHYFNDIEKRRIMGGLDPYGWLGHVSASGRFRGLLANGTPVEHSIIVRSVNEIASFDPPVPWAKLRIRLMRLTELGPTMKVWSRLLCLVRPDLYCTISSDSVRQNLSATLGIPQSGLSGVDGYIGLIQLIHASPWFGSRRPSLQREARIWERRVAFLDAVLY